MQKVKNVLQQDVTHHTVLTLAAFGLVVASTITTLGVATLGVQAQIAFAQNETVVQTAAALMGDDRQMPRPMPAMANGSSSEPQRPPKEMVASSTTTMATLAGMYCPKIVRSISRGSKDATTTGDISELQRFFASKYGLNASTTISGYFGSTTEKYLHKFQNEQGIASSTNAGPLTRAAIYRLCGPKFEGKNDQRMGSTSPLMGSSTLGMPPRGDKPEGKGDKPEGKNDQMGSTTHMIASTTEPRHERPAPPMPPQPTTAPTPVSYIDNSSNAASVIEALNQIGSGYTKLLQATLASIGL